MRYLAIDPGQKRVGLAVGDDTTGLASPAGVIQATSEAQQLDGIAQAIAQHEPHELVVGLPLHIDGTPGAGAQAAQAFAQRLNQRFGLPVHLADERLSSYEADLQMSRTGLTHKRKKERRDALAAAVTLQAFLASRQA